MQSMQHRSQVPVCHAALTTRRGREKAELVVGAEGRAVNCYGLQRMQSAHPASTGRRRATAGNSGRGEVEAFAQSLVKKWGQRFALMQQ